MAKELSPIQSPDAPTPCEKSGLALLLLYQGFASAGEAQTIKVDDGWQYVRRHDPFSDRGAMYYVLKVNESGKSAFAFKCDPGSSSVYIHAILDDYIGSRYENYRGRIRVDRGEVIEDNWAADGRAALLIDPSAVQRIADYAAAGEQLFLRVATYDYGSADLEINLKGSRRAISWLFEQCATNAASS